jgi:mannosyltransferase OCH1-like enzyme
MSLSLKQEDFDNYLKNQNCKIIHQIWFDTGIQTRIKAKKSFKKLKKFQHSWMILNPTWYYKLWTKRECRIFMKLYYPEHLELYDKYPHFIQKCDAVRYFLLLRYGGIYADLDYCCLKPLEPNLFLSYEVALVENNVDKVDCEISVSNALMFSSVKEHMFWKSVILELQETKHSCGYYYGKYLTVLYTTGSLMLNRVFLRLKNKHKINTFSKLTFNPQFYTFTDNSLCSAYHLGLNEWVTKDLNSWLFFYREIIFLIICILFIILPKIFFKHSVFNKR